MSEDGSDVYVDATDSMAEGEADDLEAVELPDSSSRVTVRKRRRDLEVPPPRRWERVSSQELRRCPKCHVVVAGVRGGFWHLNAAHGGDDVDEADTEAWADDLRAEVDELRDAFRTSRSRWTHSGALRDDLTSGSAMAAALLAVIVVMIAAGLIMLAAGIGR